MKKNWLQIVTLCLCIVLLVVTVLQGRRLEEYQQMVDSRIESLTNSLDAELQNVSNRIEWELEEASRSVSEYTLEPVGLDGENRAILADVTVLLKEWYADTQITLQATVGEEILSLPMTSDEKGTFSARLSLPLEGNCELFLNALISGGGLTKQETLGGWADFSMMLPLQSGGCGWTGPGYQDGVLTSQFSVAIEGRDGNTAVVRNPEFRVYKNGELAQTLAAVVDPYSTTDFGYYYTVNTPEHIWSIECAVGDVIEIHFRCEDEFGLGYEFPFHNWIIEGETSDEQVVYGEDMVGNAPELFWPE